VLTRKNAKCDQAHFHSLQWPGNEATLLSSPRADHPIHLPLSHAFRTIIQTHSPIPDSFVGAEKSAWYTPFAPDQFPQRVWKVDTMPNFIPSITIVICCARYGGRWQCCHNSSMKHQLHCSGEQLCKSCCSSSTLNKPILYFD